MTTNKALMTRFITEYQTNRDEAVCDATLAEDIVDHTPMPGIPPGRAGVKVLFDAFHAAFAGFRAEIHDMIAEGDRVVTYKTFHGVHTGEFMGIAPTGRAVRIDLIDIVRIDGGQVVEHWNVVDQLGLLRQLGAVEG